MRDTFTKLSIKMFNTNRLSNDKLRNVELYELYYKPIGTKPIRIFVYLENNPKSTQVSSHKSSLMLYR